MLPGISIGQSCWRALCAELDRVFPREGLAVPLLFLDPRQPGRSPCASLGLQDLREVVIARILTVPAFLQVNGPVRVAVREGADHLINREVEALVGRFPQLRACAYLHSHPFAVGATHPSRGPGCDLEGHMLPQLDHNRRAGLEASFSFIACRAIGGPGWRLQGFALDGQGALYELGFARLIPDHDLLLRRASLPGLEQRPMVHRRLRRWRHELRRLGINFYQDDLFGGWLRIVLELDPPNALVVLLPIDFPAERPRCYAVDRSTGLTQPLFLDPFDYFSRAGGTGLVGELSGGAHGCS